MWTDHLAAIDNLRNAETAAHLGAVSAALDLDRAVRSAHAAGETWESIGQALGTTGQAAQQRFR
jgi:hypothetical protein